MKLDTLLLGKEVTADQDLVYAVIVSTNWWDYTFIMAESAPNLSLYSWKGKESGLDFRQAICIISRYEETFKLLGVYVSNIDFYNDFDNVRRGSVNLYISPCRLELTLRLLENNFGTTVDLKNLT